MTHDQYVQFVQSSAIFQKMEKSLQQEILQATGDKMNYYVDLLSKHERTLLQAKKNYVERNEEILKKMSEGVKKMSKEKIVKDEAKSKEHDSHEEQKLLQQISNL